jgi:hypothetical protein
MCTLCGKHHLACGVSGYVLVKLTAIVEDGAGGWSIEAFGLSLTEAYDHPTWDSLLSPSTFTEGVVTSLETTPRKADVHLFVNAIDR